MLCVCARARARVTYYGFLCHVRCVYLTHTVPQYCVFCMKLHAFVVVRLHRSTDKVKRNRHSRQELHDLLPSSNSSCL
jgi:hypothetical protein